MFIVTILFLFVFICGCTFSASSRKKKCDDNPAIYLDRVKEIELRLAGEDLSNTILLTGSSIMEYWQTSREDLLPVKSVNIGIGGTKVIDWITYFDRLIKPYNPKAILIYVGSNDINGIPTISKSGKMTADLVIEYLEIIRANFPDTPVAYISIMEAPAKVNVLGEIRLANQWIASYIQEHDNFLFIDCAKDLLNTQGVTDRSLFLEDELHMKPEGYHLWGGAIKTQLFQCWRWIKE